MYSNLAPRLGQSAFSASAIGTAELRGGKINWGSLGSSISNAFRTTGRFLSNAASRFGRSQAYADIKKGLEDSGVVKNVAGLAGETLNSLVDIGRIKVENELQKLRDRVLNTIPADQLAQILLNYQQSHDKITVPQDEAAIPAVPIQPVPQAAPVAQPLVPVADVMEVDNRKRPVEEPSYEPPMDSIPYTGVYSGPSPYKRRIRGTGEAEWQTQLNSMLGQGVNFTSSKHCY
nr:pVI-C [Siadenovirus sp.]